MVSALMDRDVNLRIQKKSNKINKIIFIHSNLNKAEILFLQKIFKSIRFK